MIPMDVREMSHAGEQSSLLQDLQMRTDQKDIRLKEPSEMEIKGVMDQIEQAPEGFVDMFQQLEETGDLNKQIYGNKTFDFAGLRNDEEQPLDQPLSLPKDAKRREKFEKMLLGKDGNLSAKVNKFKQKFKIPKIAIS